MRRLRRFLNRSAAAGAVASFSVLPVLFFTANNTAELKVSEAFEIVIFALVFGGVVWTAGRLLLRSWTKGALFTIAVTFPAYHYATLMDSLGGALYAAILLFLGIVFLLAWRLSEPIARTLTAYFAVLGAVLVVMNLLPIVRDFVRIAQVDVTVDNEDFVQAAADAKVQEQPPDIYYIVLDRYTGQLGLKERFGFDNSAFVAELRGKGFFVTDASFANYPITAPSMASSLNAGPLRAHGPVKEINTRKPLHELVERPQVVQSLKDKGYEYVLVGSWWGPTQRSPIADVNPEYAWNVEAFGQRFHTGNAAGHFFTDTVFAGLIEQVLRSDYTASRAHGPIFTEQLAELRHQAGRRVRGENTPKFVLAHILMPHPPYVFDADGTVLPASFNDPDRYIRQLRYTNREIGKLMDDILAADRDNPPVIVVAADEGEYTRRFDPDASDAEIRQKTNILNAYYFPGRDYGALYPTITPVNTFRVVFNEFFGTQLPLLPDRTNASPSKRPLDWVDVTDRVRKEPR